MKNNRYLFLKRMYPRYIILIIDKNNKYIRYGIDKQIMDSIRFSIKRLKELNINYLILKELRIMESKEFKQNNYLLYYKRFKINNMVNYCFKKINDTIFDD